MPIKNSSEFVHFLENVNIMLELFSLIFLESQYFLSTILFLLIL